MNIYAIFNSKERAFVKRGRNGGGFIVFCLYSGFPCFWKNREEAQACINSFNHPEDYEIRTFAEIDG